MEFAFLMRSATLWGERRASMGIIGEYWKDQMHGAH